MPRPHRHARATAVITALATAGTAAALAAPATAARATSPSGPHDPLGAPVPAGVVRASSAPGSHWRPQPARYGTAAVNNIPVRMRDGTVLRVNVIYPTNPKTGKKAAGRFPVLLTQTPYGKGSGSGAGSSASPTGGSDPYLVDRGFIEVVADVRGTGDSGGAWGLFDPVQARDSVTLIDWCAHHLAHSAGTVGLYGPSYLGINQLFAAAAVGRHSPLKAIFPVVAANDIYRDTSFMGGIVDNEFDQAYLGLTGTLNAVNPLTDQLEYPDPSQLGPVEAQHAKAYRSYYAASEENVLSGGSEAYDGRYWQLRAPQNYLARIVANGIPAYLVGGEYDLFQRGEPLNFAGLQNAYHHRSDTAPMPAREPVTGRYQLIIGPWTHLVASAEDFNVLELEWFDTWLLHEHTGMGRTPTPLHVYDIGTGRWAETAHYPYTGGTPTRLYFGPGRSGTAVSTNDGTLTTSRPRSAGSDPLAWTPSGSPCGRPLDQWSMGAGTLVTQALDVSNAPCFGDDETTAAGPGAVSYTTAPFRRARTVEGPIDVTVYATATTSNTEWVAEIEKVAPNGSAYPLTEGALLGSLRAVDRARSWRTSTGQLLLPYHPYTEASARPVVAGRVTRYDIEVFPTFATIPAGYRLRVTLATSDTPHLAVTPPQASQLAGGVYQVQRSPAFPSAVELLLGRPET